MNSYRYRITVEALTDANGALVQGRTLTFDTMNHDDILGIVERLRKRLPFDGVTAASLGVGLKLFSEVALMHRADPLFAKIRPALSEFIGELKNGSMVAGTEQMTTK